MADPKAKHNHDAKQVITETQDLSGFTKLPTELRKLVWEHFCPDLGTKGCVFDFRQLAFHGGQVLLRHGELLRKQTEATRVLKAINQEGHHYVERRFPEILTLGQGRSSICIPFNPSMDIVRVDLELEDPTEGQLWSPNELRVLRDFFEPIQMIAVTRFCSWDYYILRTDVLSSLQTIYFEQNPTITPPTSLGWFHDEDHSTTHRLNLEVEDGGLIQRVHVWPDSTVDATFVNDKALKDVLNFFDPGRLALDLDQVAFKPLYLWVDSQMTSHYDQFIAAGGALQAWPKRPRLSHAFHEPVIKGVTADGDQTTAMGLRVLEENPFLRTTVPLGCVRLRMHNIKVLQNAIGSGTVAELEVDLFGRLQNSKQPNRFDPKDLMSDDEYYWILCSHNRVVLKEVVRMGTIGDLRLDRFGMLQNTVEDEDRSMAPYIIAGTGPYGEYMGLSERNNQAVEDDSESSEWD